MAGARTQGVGRGVNWGAFGAMGQQYAEIGRTIERGGSALGEGIGRGLGAIGGAIERKKERDQQAAERQKDRDLRAQERQQDWDYRMGRDAIEDARYEERIQREAQREDIAGDIRNLGMLAQTNAKLHEQTGDPQYLHEANRSLEAIRARLAAASPGLAPGVVTGSAMERPEIAPFNDTDFARDHLRRVGIEDQTLDDPGMVGLGIKTPYGAIEARFRSRRRLEADKASLENAKRAVSDMDDRNPLQKAMKYRAQHIVTSAAAKLAGRESAIEQDEQNRRGMATAQAEREKQARQAAEEARRASTEQAAAARLSGSDPAAILAGAGQGYSAEAAQARVRQIEMDRKQSLTAPAAEEAMLAEVLAGKDKRAVLGLAGRGISAETAARRALQIEDEERKASDKAKEAAEKRGELRRKVLEKAIPNPLYKPKPGEAGPLEAFDAETLATAFDADLTDAQATAIGGHLIQRYGSREAAAQAALNAMPPDAQNDDAVVLRIARALGIPVKE